MRKIRGCRRMCARKKKRTHYSVIEMQVKTEVEETLITLAAQRCDASQLQFRSAEFECVIFACSRWQMVSSFNLSRRHLHCSRTLHVRPNWHERFSGNQHNTQDQGTTLMFRASHVARVSSSWAQTCRPLTNRCHWHAALCSKLRTATARACCWRHTTALWWWRKFAARKWKRCTTSCPSITR